MIISDSTALITLINIDEFKILEIFSKNIILTQEVYDEITKKAFAKNFIDKKIAEGFLKVESYHDKDIFRELNIVLDKGEASSITLALQKDLPLIIDEKKGRKIAKLQGLKVIGLVGVLRFLYLENTLPKEKIKEISKKLKDSDFRISPKLLAMILA